MAQEVRLDHVLDRVLALADRGRDRLQSHRFAARLQERAQHAPIDLLEAALVDPQARQRVGGQRLVEHACARDLRQVARAAQQAVRDARRAAAALGEQRRRAGREAQAEDRGRALHDALEVRGRVGLQPLDQAEAAAEGRREQSLARRRADQREARQRERQHARVRTLVEREVHAEVLHRGVEVLLDRGGDAVDLVDEQHVALLELRQDPDQVARALERRAGGRVQAHAELARQDARQARLAQAGRAAQERVLERLAAPLRRLQRDAQVLDHASLADELAQGARAERVLELALRRAGSGGAQPGRRVQAGEGVGVQDRLGRRHRPEHSLVPARSQRGGGRAG